MPALEIEDVASPATRQRVGGSVREHGSSLSTPPRRSRSRGAAMRQQAQRLTKPAIKKPAKNKGHATSQLKPVLVESALVLKGGHLRKAMSLESVVFEGESFVKLTKREAWLCQVAAGKARGLDPLSRTTLMDDLGAALRSALLDPEGAANLGAARAADPMLGLGLDEAVTDGAMPVSYTHLTLPTKRIV